jgi:hypothetical protein
VTIADFRFAPGTTTVHAGDTITWANNGPSPHSATARDGSFNTGVLQKGQSGSHTFSKAGTFSYFCSVHPFMHGTVVVLASSTSPQSGGSQAGGSQTGTSPTGGSQNGGGSGSGSQGNQNATGSTGSSSAGSSTPTPSQAVSAGTPSLPNTGMSLIAPVVIALSLLGGGWALRRIASRG